MNHTVILYPAQLLYLWQLAWLYQLWQCLLWLQKQSEASTPEQEPHQGKKSPNQGEIKEKLTATNCCIREKTLPVRQSASGVPIFANGAVTAAFTHLFNYEGVKQYYQQGTGNGLIKWVKSWFTVGTVATAPAGGYGVGLAARGTAMGIGRALTSESAIGAAMTVQNTTTQLTTTAVATGYRASAAGTAFLGNPSAQQATIDFAIGAFDTTSPPPLTTLGLIGAGARNTYDTFVDGP